MCGIVKHVIGKRLGSECEVLGDCDWYVAQTHDGMNTFVLSVCILWWLRNMELQIKSLALEECKKIRDKTAQCSEINCYYALSTEHIILG